MIDSRRIVFVDALRGYALMGLFLIHMVEYFEVYWLHPEPGPVNTVTFAVFGGKAYALFALLFGLSFFIILQRQAQKGVDFRARFAWRTTLLLAMGYVHGLLYGGDILQLLAVTGFIILPLWRLPSGALMGVALVCLLQIPTLLYFAIMNASLAAGYSQPFFLALHPPVFDIYANGRFVDVVTTNAIDGTLAKWAFMIESGRFANVIGMAVLGCLLGRGAFFTRDDVRQGGRVLALAALVALVSILSIYREPFVHFLSGLSAPWLGYNLSSTFTNNLYALATMLLLLLLFRVRFARQALRLLAPPGRMSLTMYVGQSVLFVPFFYGFGANAHAWIGQSRALLLGVLVWIVLVALAHAWMRYFRYGPLEWAWRALTLTDPGIPFRSR